MMKPIPMPPRGGAPRLLLLDHTDSEGERAAALILPGRQPIIFPNLPCAVDALRQALTP